MSVQRVQCGVGEGDGDLAGEGRLAGAGVARGGRRGQRAARRRRLVLHARLCCVEIQPTILDALVDLFCCL